MVLPFLRKLPEDALAFAHDVGVVLEHEMAVHQEETAQQTELLILGTLLEPAGRRLEILAVVVDVAYSEAGGKVILRRGFESLAPALLGSGVIIPVEMAEALLEPELSPVPAAQAPLRDLGEFLAGAGIISLRVQNTCVFEMYLRIEQGLGMGSVQLFHQTAAILSSEFHRTQHGIVRTERVVRVLLKPGTRTGIHPVVKQFLGLVELRVRSCVHGNARRSKTERKQQGKCGMSNFQHI